MPSYRSAVTGARMRISLRLWFATYRSYKRVYHPFVDLGTRLAIAQAFFASGLVKAMDWPAALYLARYEYPLTWMSPDHAALLGVAIELVCPILLALGLFTRAAALPMALLAIVVQTNYQQLDTNLFWAAILLRYVVFGARELSIDALLAPGLSDSAFLATSRAIAVGRALTRYAGPLFQLGFRVWLGWALLRLPADPAWFPTATVAQQIPAAIAAVGGVMLIAGLGSSVANKALAAAAIGVGVMHAMAGDDPGRSWLVLTLAQVGVIGAGAWSLDSRLVHIATAWMTPRRGGGGGADWPRVVIVGAGFGGMACAAKLRFLPVELTIVDRRNHHLFQPLLYQVATAGLSPGEIAAPIRSQFRDDPNVRVVMGSVTGVDSQAKCVMLGDDQRLPYDLLVIATGASHSYFGRRDWQAIAPGLKHIEDATAIRARLLRAFEQAENEPPGPRRDALLTFVVVGGGPTGVELAGAIAELARFGLDREFRDIDPASARVMLIQSADRILPGFPAALSVRAQRSLEALGVAVRTGNRVEEIDADGVIVAGERVAAATVLWAAGVRASPAAEWLGVEPDKAGRICTTPHLGVSGHPDIFAIGDTAASFGWDGRQVPGLAAAAKQSGVYAARMIRARLEMRDPPAAFDYHHMGSMATIGRKAAVVDFGRVRLWGAPAWWLWGAVHVLLLTGVRNRLSVMVSWVWAYLTFRSGTRLITRAAGDDTL